MELYFDATGARTDRTLYASMLLQDNAATWWMALRCKGTAPTNWNDFKNHITYQFKNVDSNRRARDQIEECRQTTSVRNYKKAFEDLFYQIEDMGDMELYYKFQKGLKKEIRAELDKLPHPPATYEDLHIHAQRINDLTFYVDRSLHTKPSGHPWEKKALHKIEGDSKTSDKSNIECHYCKKKGHYKKECYKFIRDSEKKPKNWKTTKKEPKKDELSLNAIELKVKMSENSLLPARKTPGSAGYDIRPSKSGSILPGQEVRIPTGLSITIPTGHCGFIVSRSSVFWKGIFIFGVIDEDYTGEIFITAINLGKQQRTYSNNTPNGVAQLIILSYLAVTPTVVENLDKTTRTGGFGSTNLSVSLLQQKNGKLDFEGRVAGIPERIFFDCGADGSFITQKLAEKANLRLERLTNTTHITVATGQSLEIEWIAKGVPIQIQGYTGKVDLFVFPGKLPMVILGNTWFAQNNPSINWTTNDITLQDLTVIKGSVKESKPEINLIILQEEESLEDFKIDPQDQLFLVNREDLEEEDEIDQDFYDKDREDVKDPELDKILLEFDDIFKENLPPGKPTTRNVEHNIPLVEGAKPVQAYQYQLSPAHLTAIQETVDQLLKDKHIDHHGEPPCWLCLGRMEKPEL